MTKDEIRNKVLQILGSIAPEADLEAIEPDKNLRDQFDLDSMDYLNFVIALDDEFKANIKETDYTKFTTLNACVDRMAAAIGSPV